MLLSRLLLSALVLFIASSPVHAAATGTITRYGLSETEFRAANQELFGKGMRLVDLTVAEVKGKPVIGAIWVSYEGAPAGTPERVKLLQSLIYLKQSRAEVEATSKRLGQEGSLVETVDAYVSNGKPVYATVYAPAKEPAGASIGMFLSNDELTQLREEAIESGFDVLRLEVEATPKDYLYFVSFIESDEIDMKANFAATRVEFGATQASLEQAGRYPFSISAFQRPDGAAGYASLSLKSDKSEVVVGLPLADFRAKMEPILAHGGEVLDIDSFASGDEVQYSAAYVPKG